MDDSKDSNSSSNVVNTNETVNSVSEKKKPKKPGIIYLNYIPRYMTVKKVREYFAEFGEVRRLFLKPERSKKQGKPSKFFSEGWIEFSRRKVAKRVAKCLNGIQVGGKRHTPYYDALWSIKYLSKFRWDQLSEGKAYEKARKEQRMRVEISKVKREVDFYTQGVVKRKKSKLKLRVVDEDAMLENARRYTYPAFQTVNLSDENQPSVKRKKSKLKLRVVDKDAMLANAKRYTYPAFQTVNLSDENQPSDDRQSLLLSKVFGNI